MTTKSLKLTVSILSGILFYCSGPMYAEPAVVADTTYEGTVSTFDPTSSAISVESSAGPRSYVYTPDTQFVDSEGRVIRSEQVKRGLPVTIYYTPEGERMIVKKVMVRRPIVTHVEETTTTTTTHEKD